MFAAPSWPLIAPPGKVSGPSEARPPSRPRVENRRLISTDFSRLRSRSFQDAKKRAGRKAAPSPSDSAFTDCKSPKLLYLPTLREGLLTDSPTDRAFSCCRPDIGRRSWRFEG